MREVFVVASPKTTALRPLNYSPELDGARSFARRARSTRLGDVAKIGRSYSSRIIRRDCDRAHGVELLVQSDMFQTEPVGQFVRPDSMASPEDHRIQRWQILLAGAGTLGANEIFGRCVLADNRLTNKYVAEHAISLSFEDPSSNLALFTYAFLSSRLGVRAVRTAAYGTKILGVRLDILRDIPIPLAEDETIAIVAERIREMVEQREAYADLLAQARRLIDGLPEMNDALGMCEQRKARCLVWSSELRTLSAWNYAAAGEALRFLTSRWSRRLTDAAAPGGIRKGGRFARIGCLAPHGVRLLSQRDVYMTRPVGIRIVTPSDATSLRTSAADIFLASRGQVVEGGLFGKPELGEVLPRDAMVSEDFVRLSTRDGERETLFAFLGTKVGLRLIQTTAYGTSIPGMRLDLLSALPLPSFTPTNASTVKQLVVAAATARVRANAAELSAIDIIEKEVLPRWLA